MELILRLKVVNMGMLFKLLYIMAMKTFLNKVLEKGVNVNIPDGKYGTALQAAAFLGNRTAVECLLEQEANVDAQEAEFGSTLGAVAYRNKDMVKYHPERAVAFWGHGDMVRYILDCGADINVQGGEYSSALQAAAFNGYIDIDACHVLNGKDTDSQGRKNDDNVLNGALCGGNKWIVRLLSDNGAEINALGGEFGHALQAAVYVSSNHPFA
ncbi:ankyrin repeat-containing domain protein [Lentinula lateritia]|nr:ankyrin repeat-containing domain protein [Lentinula lateritia]